MGIALDGSTPAVIDDIGTSSATEVTASFSPPAKSLVVVVVNLVYAAGMPWSSEPLTVSDSLSNSYAAGPIAQDPSYYSATSGIFTNYYASAPGSITLTVTRNPPTLYPALFEVVTYVLTGARASQSGAGSAATYISSPSSGVVYSNITVTSGSSWVIVGAAVEDVSSTISGSPSGVGGTTVEDHQNETTDYAASVVGHATGASGSTALGWTWDSITYPFSWAALEVLSAELDVPVAQVSVSAPAPRIAAPTLLMALAAAAGSDDAGNAFAAGFTGRTYAFQPGTLPLALEAPHAMPAMSNSWAAGSGGQAKYQVNANGNLEVSFVLRTVGTLTDGTAIWAAGGLPAGYRPPVAKYIPITVVGTYSASGDTPSLLLGTDGSVKIYGLSGSTLTGIDAHGVIPLNL